MTDDNPLHSPMADYTLMKYYYLVRAVTAEPDPVKAFVALSGHVQKIYWTNF